MRKRKTTELNNPMITVDVSTLMNMLCVGRDTAHKIGNDAGAVIYIGRRKLFNVKKIQEYIDNIVEV